MIIIEQFPLDIAIAELHITAMKSNQLQKFQFRNYYFVHEILAINNNTKSDLQLS